MSQPLRPDRASGGLGTLVRRALRSLSSAAPAPGRASPGDARARLRAVESVGTGGAHPRRAPLLLVQSDRIGHGAGGNSRRRAASRRPASGPLQEVRTHPWEARRVLRANGALAEPGSGSRPLSRRPRSSAIDRPLRRTPPSIPDSRWRSTACLSPPVIRCPNSGSSRPRTGPWRIRTNVTSLQRLRMCYFDTIDENRLRKAH
jgi:hypothetical protein